MKITDKIADSNEVSVRLRTCCKAAGIETFDELINTPKTQLLKFRNFGRRSIIEVDELRVQLTK